MYRNVFILSLLCVLAALQSNGQANQYIYGDNVKVLSRNGSSTFYILNSTSNVPGFLYNVGGGRTEFRRGAIRISDTSWLIGADTLHFTPGSGGSTDLSNYYTKGQADAAFQPKGTYLTGITSSQVTTALGFTPIAATALTPYELSTHAAATYQPIGAYVPAARTITINGTTLDLSANRSWTIATDVGSVAWGTITGTLSGQTDLQAALDAKQNSITTGTTGQYFRGDLSLATFPTAVSAFTNDAGYLTNTTGDARYSLLAHTHTFASLTSKPTTLSGYGITDAYPLSGNPSNFLTGITAEDINTALGFTVANSNDPDSLNGDWGFNYAKKGDTATYIATKTDVANVSVSGVIDNNTIIGDFNDASPLRVDTTLMATRGYVLAHSGSGGATALSGLSDVQLTSLATNDFLKYNGTKWINRTPANVKTDLSLNNVENTALSTWAGSSNITTVGTITGGTWQGNAISTTYLPAATVYNNQANTYTAGAKQTFGASATTAGMNFSGVTANPSSLSSGDFWYRSDEKKYHYYDGTTDRKIVSETLAQTLTNKTIDGSSNTITNVPKAIFACNLGASTVNASTNTFALPLGATTFNATENFRLLIMPEAGTLKNLTILTNSTQTANGNLTITVRKNNAATALVITIPTGSVAGVYSNTTDAVSFAAGDKFSIQVNNAGTDVASAQIISISSALYQ